MELRVSNLTKKYGSKVVLNNIKLELDKGIYGLLGENGAGKTTLMRTICDLVNPTKGEITFGGEDIRKLGDEYRSLLGYLPQDFGYYPDFTAKEFMEYIGALKGFSGRGLRSRCDELLKMVALEDVKHKKIKAFSGGMKQRLGIAQAMINDPRILILDEPTAGLDPKERIRLRNLLSDFASDRIVILSTHIVSDVEYIANNIFVMKAGNIILKGTVDELTDSIKGFVWVCKVTSQMAQQLGEEYSITNLKTEGEYVELRIVSEKKPIEDAISVAPTLEDLYMYNFKEEMK